MLKTDIDKQAVKKVYGRWAPIYDLVFGAIFERGRRAAIAASERIGGRILEVGVGTGISLAYYSHKCRVVGIDLSEQMLRKARQRVVERSLRNVEGLAVMDAERLDFPDASFGRSTRTLKSSSVRATPSSARPGRSSAPICCRSRAPGTRWKTCLPTANLRSSIATRVMSRCA
jgi:SAM-dependent methyltransferase